jgi:hypothetical protein
MSVKLLFSLCRFLHSDQENRNDTQNKHSDMIRPKKAYEEKVFLEKKGKWILATCSKTEEKEPNSCAVERVVDPLG